ncbi:hypothetical protein M231_04980 [Tremella mesenterica]|uniref:AMP-dependent synthetase/ligase domain-containing protein n=1 Tax=Tremella mesenterica TaxID=5217 RepID=A0A4Q1BJ52_TREME|nr:hypothetical protein M231_04980 [Tremella mesenterica]
MGSKGVKRQLSIAECDRILTAPGQILEMDYLTLHGRRVRVWKNTPRTFRESLLDKMTTYHERIFLSFPSVQGREYLTYGQVMEKSLELAAWMRSRGLGLGSKVGIVGMNCPEWIIAFTAVQIIGGISVCVNAWLPVEQLKHCLIKTRPALVLMDQERADDLVDWLPSLKQSEIESYCWASGTTLPSLQDAVKTISVAERDGLLRGKGVESLGPESDAVIFFTSGTGGPPKAVLSTQRMALTNIWSGLVAPARAALRAGLPIPPLPQPSHPQRTVLLAIPLFHVTGCLSWLMRAFFAGSKMVLLPKWSTTEAIRVIQSEGVTVIGGVPAVVSAILQSSHLPQTHVPETVFYGGAPPSNQLPKEIKSRWPKAGLVQGYGLTETNAYVCSIAGGDYLARRGPPVPVTDTMIVDPVTREPLPIGTTGLLLVRGPQVMKCYYDDEEATRKAIDEEGWLDTGDGASVDAEGFVYIKDRCKATGK